MNLPKRTKSFESKLFDRFSDDDLLKAAGLIMSGQMKNIPQLNFVQEMITRRLEREQRQGNVNIDYMSLLQVGLMSVEDSVFIEALQKAVENKRRLTRGMDQHDGYKELKKVVKENVDRSGRKVDDVLSVTKHYVKGGFDKEIEEEYADAQEADE